MVELHGHILVAALGDDFNPDVGLSELDPSVLEKIVTAKCSSDMVDDINEALAEIGISESDPALLRYLRKRVVDAIRDGQLYDISFTRNGALAYNYTLSVYVQLSDLLEEQRSGSDTDIRKGFYYERRVV